MIRRILLRTGQCMLSLIYGIIASYLLWLLFYWITPYIMRINSILFMILFFVFGILILISFFKSVSALLLLPIMFITRNNVSAKFMILPSFLFHGFSAVKLPFGLSMHYGFIQWFVGIELSLIIFFVFITIILTPFRFTEEN